MEKSVGKGKIPHYEQFLLFPQCFQKACFAGASKGVIVWEWVKKGFFENVFYYFHQMFFYYHFHQMFFTIISNNHMLHVSVFSIHADLCKLETIKCTLSFNPLPNDKIFYWSKLKAFANNKTNMTSYIVRIKRNKWINAQQKNKIWKGFEPEAPGWKANAITTELKRISFSSVVMVLAFPPGIPGSNPVQILYFCPAFIHLFLCYPLCS